MTALYKSKAWLQLKRSQGLSITEIAEICGVSAMTIDKYLELYKLKTNKRTWTR